MRRPAQGRLTGAGSGLGDGALQDGHRLLHAAGAPGRPAEAVEQGGTGSAGWTRSQVCDGRQQQVACGVGIAHLAERLAALLAQAGQQLHVRRRAVRQRLQAVDGGGEHGLPLPRVGVLPGHLGVLPCQGSHLTCRHLEPFRQVHGQLQPAAGGGEAGW